MNSTFDHVGDGRLRTLVAHWIEAAGADPMPARAALDPGKLKPVLPIIWVCDYVPETETLRYRLAGEEINQIYRRNLRGVEMHSLFPEGRNSASYQRMVSVARDRRVIHAVGQVYSMTSIAGSGERIVLPLATDGVNPDGVVGATAYQWPRGERPPEVVRQEMHITATPIDDFRPRKQRT